MLVAATVAGISHTQKAAARFSEMLRSGGIQKRYYILVKGDLSQYGRRGHIDRDLNGKSALTRYEMIRYDPRLDASLAAVYIETGRLHQIRRHFEQIGFPVMGDPRYGTGNKHMKGLRLAATGLCFRCPYTHKRVEVEIDVDLMTTQSQ